MIERYDATSLHMGCNAVAARDEDLKNIIATLGYPPLWVRPNTFDTLVLTILEQQVSLASAYTAFKKLQEKVHRITPAAILNLSDADLRACSITRQKTSYSRGLATALLHNHIDLKNLDEQPDDLIRESLKKLNGIGDWTVDIYLIHALRRTDVFPTGDLALVKAMKQVKGVSATATKEDLLKAAEPWRPYRTFATLLLWHYYIQIRGIKLAH